MTERLTYINLSMKSSLKRFGGDVRVHHPYGLLDARRDVSVRFQYDQISLKAPREATEKVFVRYRPIGTRETWPLQRGAHELGYLTIVDLDDMPFHEEFVETDFVVFRAAHAVQVSTPLLAELVRRYNPEVRVIPNQIRDIPPFVANRERPPRIFFGALNREASWSAILPALNRVLSARPEVGVDVIWDRPFFNALETANKRLHPAQPYESYLDLLGAADICLLPLGADPIDLYKSDLKFLEASSRGTACLVSPTVYAATVKDGVTALLFRSPEEFEIRLTTLINDTMRRVSIIEAAHHYVSTERRLADHVDARLEWYRELLARKPDLDRLVRERAGWLLEGRDQPPRMVTR